MSDDLFSPGFSVTPTRRRRLLWVAYWTGPPMREPFRKPDASSGGARSLEEARRAAERAAGRPLVELDRSWARAYARLLRGEPPWPSSTGEASGSSGRRAQPEPGALASALSVLGLSPGASPDEIKRAYRRLALSAHPDAGGTTEAFVRLHRALEAAMAASARRRRRRR